MKPSKTPVTGSCEASLAAFSARCRRRTSDPVEPTLSTGFATAEANRATQLRWLQASETLTPFVVFHARIAWTSRGVYWPLRLPS